MKEREIKFKVVEEPSLFKLRAYLSNECKFSGKYRQIDIYLSHPCRDFRLTDEALRIRMQKDNHGNDEVEITYKGPREAEILKVREEFTIKMSDIKDYEKILALFHRLGFKAIMSISKSRENYDCKWFNVSLDDVESLGKFIEIELKGEAPQEKIIEIVNALSAHGVKIELVSKTYLELLLEMFSY